MQPTFFLRTACQTLAVLIGATAWPQSTARASVDSSGGQGNSESGTYGVALSADGRYVAFESNANNLVPGDTNGSPDVFVRDRQSGTTERVSVDSNGVEANNTSGSYGVAISADGRFVAFMSWATNLVAGDTNGSADVFVRDRQTGTTGRVSVDSTGVQGNLGSGLSCVAISADGRFVAFDSVASDLVAADNNGTSDIFVRDRQTGTTERASVDSNGVEGNDYSGLVACSLSADGRCVSFASRASNLAAGDTNGTWDVFVHDRQTGATELVSVDSSGVVGNNFSSQSALSADGRCVAFCSVATDLVPGDTNNVTDVFLRDRQAGTTVRVSVGPGGVEADGSSLSIPTFSSDSRYVAFDSQATNLVPGDSNAVTDVFVYDRLSGTNERVSVDSAGAEADLQSHVFSGSLSADGNFVALESTATNLVSGDTNAFADVFVRDRDLPPQIAPFCPGDGSVVACPCGNNGAAGNGCENSVATGGALLSATGNPSLSADTLQFSSSGELPHALSIFLQGATSIGPVHFGDGLRCTGGTLKRLYIENAVNGTAIAPVPGDPSVSARSAALNDPLSAGTTRYYQVYYRDPDTNFCPSPTGNTYNISSGLSVLWGF